MTKTAGSVVGAQSMAAKAAAPPPPSRTAPFLMGLLLGAALSAMVSFFMWHGGHVAVGATPVAEGSSSNSATIQSIIDSFKQSIPQASGTLMKNEPNLSAAAPSPKLQLMPPSDPSSTNPVKKNDKDRAAPPSPAKPPSTSTGALGLPAKSMAVSANATALLNDKKEKCRVKYGQRGYLPEELKRLPPMFYTFPGAGNTWGRLLIEYATGVLTGSVYNDGSLLKPLPGEFTCNWQVSAVKAHPHTHTFAALHGHHVPSDDGKCNKGGIKRFNRAILVIRDPYDSIWSEYQRRISKSHVEGIPKADFSWRRWQANAASLAHYYHEMWAVEHAGIERVFPPEDYIYIKYEDLKSRDTRMAALQRMVDFLRYKHLPQKDLEERLSCAFALAENKDAHRRVDKARFMTKDVAYVPEIACRMWALFGQFASKHGYHPWGGYNCTGYHKIPSIHVGPGGEIDRTNPQSINILTPDRINQIIRSYLNTTDVKDPSGLVKRSEVRRRPDGQPRPRTKSFVNPALVKTPGGSLPAPMVGGPGAAAGVGAGGGVKRRRPAGMEGRKRPMGGGADVNKLLSHADKVMGAQQ